MTVVSPPRPPQQLPAPDRDALIKEARARQRRRRIRLAVLTAATAAIGFGVYALMASGGSTAHSTTGEGSRSATAYRCPPGDLGTVAFLRGNAPRCPRPAQLPHSRPRSLPRGRARAFQLRRTLRRLQRRLHSDSRRHRDTHRWCRHVVSEDRRPRRHHRARRPRVDPTRCSRPTPAA